MRGTIESKLSKLGILPVSSSRWKHFDIILSSDSTVDQYKEVKRTILEAVGKGMGGVYIIKKQEKVLYIGESAKNIHRRLIRHIDKVYKRTDSRADFFKLEEHQGHLSIYYLALCPAQIGKRKAIEDLLTIVLEPEYKRWDTENKLWSLTEGAIG